MKPQNQNLQVSLDCYRDQFRKQLDLISHRLNSHITERAIVRFYYQGISESQAIDKFLEANPHLLERN